MFEPTPRYPDHRVRALSDEFASLTVFNARVESLHTGTRWAEGPVWFGDHRCLLWSDIPRNTLLRWDEQNGAVSVFRWPSHFANGNTRDLQGRLVTCEHQTRRVTRTELDGRITVLASEAEGRPLNSPNDVVVARDGSVWFTDPHYGRVNPYEGGERGVTPRPGAVYRADPASGVVDTVITGLTAPNGLAFSPTEDWLYVVDSGGDPRSIWRYAMADGRPREGELFISANGAHPDGLRVDEDGNLWCGWGGEPQDDGVRVFAADGHLIGAVDLPERCANLCFGGERGDLLLMAASTSLYALTVGVRGAVR